MPVHLTDPISENLQSSGTAAGTSTCSRFGFAVKSEKCIPTAYWQHVYCNFRACVLNITAASHRISLVLGDLICRLTVAQLSWHELLYAMQWSPWSHSVCVLQLLLSLHMIVRSSVRVWKRRARVWVCQNLYWLCIDEVALFDGNMHVQDKKATIRAACYPEYFRGRGRWKGSSIRKQISLNANSSLLCINLSDNVNDIVITGMEQIVHVDVVRVALNARDRWAGFVNNE